MKINGFEYSIKINANEFPVICISGTGLKSPDSLSKYYSVNENSVASFIQRQLFVSTPESFNDIFDSLYLKLDYNKITFEKISRFIEPLDLDRENADFEKDKEKYITKFRNTLFAIWNAHCGIICMTENKTEDLMWAHYSNNEGFLVEFNYTLFPENFGSPCQINYVPLNEMLKLSNGDIFLSLYINSLLKKEIWKYENEYRFIVHDIINRSLLTSGRFSNESHDYEKESRLVKYPELAIKKVILGLKFFNNFLVDTKHKEYTLDFSKKGLVHKSLIDNLIENKILIEWIYIDSKNLQLESKAITISKVSGTIYKLT
jgi:hypothetical protein